MVLRSHVSLMASLEFEIRYFLFQCPHSSYDVSIRNSVKFQFSSVAQLCPTFCDPMYCSMPGLPAHHKLWVYSNSCSLSWWCHPNISSSVVPFSSHLQSVSASGSSNESVLCIRWPKYWSFSFNISPFDEYSWLISFRMDWLDLLAVQHHSSKASILWHSVFFIVQRSHPYMTTGKTIVLTRWTFVRKVMSLLFNVLSRLVIALLPRSKHLLISWLQSPSAVTLEPRKINSATVFTVFPPICHDVMGPDAKILVLSQVFHSPLHVHQEAL